MSQPRKRRSAEPLKFRSGPATSGAEPDAVTAPPDDSPLFLNRELSWLDFNRRVLEEAKDPSNPLLERLKFVAIFGSNLDEFFMKRIGGLKQQVASNLRDLAPDGRSPRQQLEAIYAVVRPLIVEQHRVYLEELVPALRQNGVELLRWDDLRAAERRWAQTFFDEQVLPVLTPLALDPAHPFPFISNLSLSLAVAVRQPGSTETRFARVKVPPSIPRWVQLPDSLRFLPLEELIAHHLEHLFLGMEVLESHCFRVTRNADLQIDDDPADDLLEQIQEELRERRFATAVRLQIVESMPEWMRELLCQELQVGPDDVFAVPPPLALAGLMQLANLPLFALRYEPWRPVTHPRLQAPAAEGETVDLFQVIARGDILVHHPYESFATSVQRFIQQAARDPQVLAIKQTLYRTQKDSPIVNALIEAAEAGKQVAVTVELKARFDEQRNIEWAEKLEEAGAHVTYGLVGLKTHTKLALVVRQEAQGLKSYVHVATGNYNAETATFYTDFGLMTCRPEIAADVMQVFNLLTGYVHQPKFRRLLVAPSNLRTRFQELIEREIAHQRAGRGGRIIAKMNALEDPSLVRALYRASAEGVEIDLIVRGICRLRPGVPGHSATIRVRSIIGRFLEHARVFLFGNGGDPEYFLGSADWMSRNLDYRVEAITPVEDPVLREDLRQALEIELADTVKAWELQSDGSWKKAAPVAGVPARSSQQQFMERALQRGTARG